MSKNNILERLVLMKLLFSGTYLEIPDKVCSPKTILAEAGTPLSNVKELCAVDSTCMYFYESVVVRGYWKCSSTSILEYGRGLTLFSKGKLKVNLTLNSKI